MKMKSKRFSETQRLNWMIATGAQVILTGPDDRYCIAWGWQHDSTADTIRGKTFRTPRIAIDAAIRYWMEKRERRAKRKW